MKSSSYSGRLASRPHHERLRAQSCSSLRHNIYLTPIPLRFFFLLSYNYETFGATASISYVLIF